MAVESSHLQFIPVRLNTLRGGDTIRFDVFIRVGEKMIHYLRRAESFDQERLRSLKAKGVRKLFILTQAEPDYLRYLDEGIQSLGDGRVLLEERAAVANDALMNLSASAERSFESETRYREMEGRVQKVIGFVRSENGAALSMLRQSGVAGDELQHAANVVTLSLMLAAKVKITQPKEIVNLSIAALMHDIGKAGLNLDFNVSREQLSPEALALYKSHPAAGIEKIRDKPYVNPEILTLILNHEEIGEGVGFPEEKRISTLPLLQQVLNLCNEYDRSCTVMKLTPEQAIKRFLVERIGLFPLPLIMSLKEVLQAGG